MKRIEIILLLPILLLADIDLNNTYGEQLNSLPLSEKQKEDIRIFISQRNGIDTIYDLLEIESLTIIDINKIKPLVEIFPREQSSFIREQNLSSYKVKQWLASEGSKEGLSDIWLDRIFKPGNINEMSYDELSALPNLSPIDVAAVMKQQRIGEIKGSFELRNAPGISYWGYRNLIDFVDFESRTESKPQLHGRYSQLIRTVPVTTNPDNEGTILAFKNSSRPELFQKLSLQYGNHIKMGLSHYQNMGNPKGIYTKKIYGLVENIDLGAIRLDKFILGNFSAAFGQGVVFETGDYFTPRRTGFGFTKKANGVNADVTRSSQYILNGLAVQFSNSLFRTAFFISKAPRDAIINRDSSFTSLIVMQPRLPMGANNDSLKIISPLTSSVTEMTWGGNVRVMPIVGLHVGITVYESLYDRILSPQVVQSVTGGADDNEPDFDLASNTNDYDEYSGDAFYLSYMSNSADPEIAAMYQSNGSSPIWKDAQSYRRVLGFDYGFVLGNMSIQGEYGEISKGSNFFKFNEVPNAFVTSLYAQFDNLNFLVLYRDYDLEFDNPYQRSFSNYQRFKTSIFEDGYWLEDPVYSFLYSGNPQPQSEQGFYFFTRYQFHRSLVSYINWDTWTRKADDAKYYRTVLSVDWRPVFNYRINIRQKWQERGSFDIFHPSPFDSRETRIRFRLRLSRFNQLELLYSRGYTTFSPRPRLTESVSSGAEMKVGDIGSPDETIGISGTHNFSDAMTLKGGVLFIQGFLWNFEDTDFRIFSAQHGAMHSWVSWQCSPVNNFTIKLKVSFTGYDSYSSITSGKSDSGRWISRPVVNESESDFRLQIDYAI